MRLRLLLDGFDGQIISFVAPAVIGEFKIQPQLMARVFSAGLIGIFVGCLFLAPLADWLGRRWVMIVSVFIFSAATLATSRVGSLDEFTALRFLAGIGLGACMPNALALTSEYAPTRLRGALTTWMFTGFSVGAFASGMPAAQFIPVYGWRSLFIVGGRLPLALTLLMVFALPESVRHLTAKGASPARISAILSHIHPDPQLDLGVRFVLGEENVRGFTLPHLFSEKRAIGTLFLWIMFFLMLFDLYLLASWTPTVLNGAGLTREQAVYIGTIQQAGSVVATIVLGPLFDRMGFFRTLIPLLIAAAAGVVVMGVAGTISLHGRRGLLWGRGRDGWTAGASSCSPAPYPTFIRATGVGWGSGSAALAGSSARLPAVPCGCAMEARQIFRFAAVPPLVVAALLLGMSRFAQRGSQQGRGAQLARQGGVLL